MERCDFSSVAATMRRYINDDHYYNQIDYIGNLFADFLGSDEVADFGFDNGSVCRWLNGMTRVSPMLSKYYLDPEKRSALADNIKNAALQRELEKEREKEKEQCFAKEKKDKKSGC